MYILFRILINFANFFKYFLKHIFTEKNRYEKYFLKNNIKLYQKSKQGGF